MVVGVDRGRDADRRGEPGDDGSTLLFWRTGTGSDMMPESIAEHAPVAPPPGRDDTACRWCGETHEGGPEQCASDACEPAHLRQPVYEEWVPGPPLPDGRRTMVAKPARAGGEG